MLFMLVLLIYVIFVYFMLLEILKNRFSRKIQNYFNFGLHSFLFTFLVFLIESLLTLSDPFTTISLNVYLYTLSMVSSTPLVRLARW